MLVAGEIERSGPPWEMSGSWLRRFGSTVRGVLFSPGTLFGSMRREGGSWMPVAFALLGSFIGSLFSSLYLAIGLTFSFFQEVEIGVAEVVLTNIAGTFLVAGVLLGVSTCGLHLSALTIGARLNELGPTLRIVSYTYGSVTLCQMIPVVGSVLGVAWGVVAATIGVSEVYETTGFRALAVVLVPVVVLPVLACGGIAVAILLVIQVL